jgi:hypothetical protein
MEWKECGCCRSWGCEDEKKKAADLPGCLYSKAPSTWILSFSLYTIALATIYEPRSWKGDPCYSPSSLVHTPVYAILSAAVRKQLQGRTAQCTMAKRISLTGARRNEGLRGMPFIHALWNTFAPFIKDSEWSWLALKQPSLKLV